MHQLIRFHAVMNCKIIIVANNKYFAQINITLYAQDTYTMDDCV